VGTVAQGVVNFPVKIVVENPDPALKPGMTAAVNITTEQRDNVLLVPNRAIRASGGQRVVIVLFEGQQISVPVTVGLSNDTHSEILTGSLKEGDTVLTSSAAASTTTRTGGGFLLGGGGFGGP
jgi:HlyD family secretion protein